jgi:hypothetical protein
MNDEAREIIEEARKTLERTSRENLDKSRLRYRENVAGVDLLYSEPPEDPLEKWRREMGELAEEQASAKSLLAFAREIHHATLRQRSDMNESMKAVNKFAETIVDRIHELGAEVELLRTRMATAETRFEDLKRSFDARPPKSAEVVEMPRRA